MNNKCIAIVAALVAVSMLAGIVATTPITTVYETESETGNNIKCNIDGIATSGESVVANSQSCDMDNFESFGP